MAQEHTSLGVLRASFLPIALSLLFGCQPSGPDKADAQNVGGPAADVNAPVVPRSAKGRAPHIDRSSPTAVLVSIKDVVATDALDSLKAFCDPVITTGSPAWVMCGIATEDMDQVEKFRNWFSTARVDREPVMSGDTARLAITLAPGHEILERRAFLVLVVRDGVYFMNNLEWIR